MDTAAGRAKGGAERRKRRDTRARNEELLDAAAQRVQLGGFEVAAWFTSSYPRPINKLETIHLCEFCLAYFDSRDALTRHARRCDLHHPPGAEIYRSQRLSFWELDGQDQKVYCQNLCLLAKLFLDHKTLFHEVESFWFYVLTAWDESGAQILGYFSKEKDSKCDFNLACLLTLPQHQQRGYGKLLIDFSYYLSQQEGKLGSPEKPLSDLGLVSYRSYWSDVLLSILAQWSSPEISLRSLSANTGLATNDIVSTLQALGLIKYWRGMHFVVLDKDQLAAHRAKAAAKEKQARPSLDVTAIHGSHSSDSQDSA